jgi:5'-3' exonuclease
MRVHLIDGTYELFRHFYAVPSSRDEDGREVGAVKGVVASVLGMINRGATHVGVATDHVIESFRNDMWPGYKTSAGIEPELLAQFPLLEDALRALGVTVWAMVDLEADDALAAAARTAADDPRVEQVVICTPDKDLAQCVTDPRVVQLDRRQRRLFDEAAVREKFGVSPASIPDWLALVGDNADGFPGLPGWGAKSAAAVLARYGHIEEIPVDATTWDVPVRGATKLSATLGDGQREAMLFRDLATLRADAPVGAVDDWRWRGPRPDLEQFSERFGAPELLARAREAAEGREP